MSFPKEWRAAWLVPLMLLSWRTGARAEDAFAFFEEEARVISASRLSSDAHRAPATVYVVTGEEIREMGALSIWDALRGVPGVDVMATRSSQGEVSIRGLNKPLSNHTLVLVDGRSTLNSYNDNINWESLPVTLDEIDRIEIVEGPASAVYGANAVSGVINIITLSPAKLQGGRLSYTVGERTTHEGRFVYGRDRDQTAFRVGSGWHTASQFENADRFSAENAKANAQLTRRFSGDAEISASGGVTRLNSQMTTGSPGAAYDKGTAFFARLDGRLAKTSLRTFWNRARSRLDQLSFPPNINLDYDTYDATLDHRLSLPGRHETAFGINGRQNSIRSSAIGNSALKSQNLWALFAEDQWLLSEKWTLVSSLRLDRHPYTKFNFSPRGSLMYTPTSAHTFRTSAGSSFRNPTLTDNFLDITLLAPNSGASLPNPPYTALSNRVVGRTDLNPEKMRMVEVTYAGRFSRWRTQVSGFHYRLKNIIAYTDAQITSLNPPTVMLESTFRNNGEIAAWGGEGSLQYHPTTNLMLWGNYSYQYLRDRIGDQIISRQSPRHKVNTGFRLRQGGWTGVLALHWVDHTFWQSAAAGGTGQTMRPVNAYVLVNGRLGYAFHGRWEGLEAAANAFNVLNHKHYEVLPATSGAAPGQNGELIRSRWSLTVAWRFR